MILEKRNDGSLVLQPDTSIEAMRRRHNSTPATLDEFEAEYGPCLPPTARGSRARPSRPARTPPVVFDDAALWAEDMIRASAAARDVAGAARRAFEADGVPIDHLRPARRKARTAPAAPLRQGLPAGTGWSRTAWCWTSTGVARRLRAGLLAFGFGTPAETFVSRRCTKSRTDGCNWDPRTGRLRLQDLAELREHP